MAELPNIRIPAPPWEGPPEQQRRVRKILGIPDPPPPPCARCGKARCRCAKR